MEKTELTQADIVSLVREYLQRRDESKFRLQLVEAGIWREDDWWNVTVKPDRANVRTIEYADALSEVEAAIREEKNLRILLVPVLDET